MANAPNFASILDEAPTEVNAPKPLPAGTYLCVVKGQPVYDKSSKKGTPYVMFNLQPVSAESDVDEEELEESGGLDGKNLRVTFYLTEDAAYRLDEFHEHCGIDLSKPAKRSERNEEILNCEVRAYVKHRMSEDGTRAYAEVSRTLKAE